jgi:hypothetical protein
MQGLVVIARPPGSKGSVEGLVGTVTADAGYKNIMLSLMSDF